MLNLPAVHDRVSMEGLDRAHAAFEATPAIILDNLGMHFTPLPTRYSMWAWPTIPEPQSRCVIGSRLKMPAEHT